MFAQIFEKYSNIKFNETLPIGSRVVPCGRTERQTDMTKLIVAYRNFADCPKEHSDISLHRVNVV